jgi:hypothetical protein
MAIERSKLLGDSSLGMIFELGSIGNATGVSGSRDLYINQV